jgi:DNA uptake protein ComE-like DNA-binding protein
MGAKVDLIGDAVQEYVNTSPLPPPLPPQNNAIAANILDLNKATEEELALLPGIGAILAKKAIALRNSMGRFHSVDDFIQDLNLSPYIAERLRAKCTVGLAGDSSPAQSKYGGRVIDY